MGAHQSIRAGNAKIDLNLDLTQKLCSSLFIPSHLRLYGGDPFGEIIARVCVQHPNIFGGGEKLDAFWDKGICDSNVLLSIRRPRPEWLSQQSFVIQRSVAPEIAVYGANVNDPVGTGSWGIGLCRLSAGVDLSEPASSNWRSTTSIKIEHIRPVNREGRSILRDADGFPITCSGNSSDNMVILRQESKYAVASDRGFSRLDIQIEQGVPLLAKWLIFNRFRFNFSKGVRLGPTLFLSSITGGSIVGDMAPYQAFAVGGLGSVRGYGEGAVGSGRSCLIVNSELTVPLIKDLEGAVFMDYGTDLGSGRHVPGNPALRQGKPGQGIGLGWGLRLNSHRSQFRLDYAFNAMNQQAIYFSLSNL